MKKGFLLLCVLGLLLSGTAVYADLLVGSSAEYGWQDWKAANQDGKPYWDNTSSDGGQKNIGYYLTGTGAFASSAAVPGAIPFWGNAAGGFDTNLYFEKDSAYSNAALRLEVAGYSGSNEFGWYNLATGQREVIFYGNNSEGAARAFTPSAEYGFYLKSNDGLFLTQAGAWNSADSTFQHFAVFFEKPDSYWIGVEDLFGAKGDKDYNDMVIKVTAVAPVPEPATMLLLGTGLLGLAGFGRRLTKTRHSH